MTKSNNEWAPEVGQECEYFWADGNGWRKARCVAVDGKRFVLADFDGEIYTGEYLHNIRHLKSEAEKRIEAMIEELCEVIYGESSFKKAATRAIEAGWIKPKPLTDEVIERLIDKHQNECETLCSFEFARMIEGYISGETL